jgi:predicted RNA-binding Zn-ribbon protein involved in translation (DUF1610 family)/ribosomal protein S27E
LETKDKKYIRCVNCSADIDDSAKFCPECGKAQILKQYEKESDSKYTIETRAVIQNYLLMVSGLFISAFLINDIAEQFGLESFYDMRTGEIFTPGADSVFGNIMTIVLLIGSLLLVILGFKGRKQQFYNVPCPYCKENIIFPVGEQAYDCVICKRRILMKNDQVMEIENSVSKHDETQ